MRLNWSHFVPLTRLKLRTWRRRSIISTTRDSGILSVHHGRSGLKIDELATGVIEYMNEEAAKEDREELKPNASKEATSPPGLTRITCRYLVSLFLDIKRVLSKFPLSTFAALSLLPVFCLPGD